MAAAEAFGKELVTSALQSGIHLDIKPYYLRMCPELSGDDYLLFNEDETEVFTVSSLFRKFIKNIIALVYGDAWYPGGCQR